MYYKMKKQLRIVICGGGNAVHVLVPVIKETSGAWVGVLAPYSDEAARISSGASENGITVEYNEREVTARPDMVTSLAEEVIPEADIVLFALPAFAHGPMIGLVAPFLKKGAWLGAMPSRSGFEFYAQSTHVRDKEIVLFGLQTLPWACRIIEYGKRVTVLGEKNSVTVGACPAGKAPEVALTLQELIGIRLKPAGSMLSISLGNVGQIIHPGIMYGLFKEEEETTYHEENVPLFYQGISKETAGMLGHMSQEIVNVAKYLSKKCSSLQLQDVISLQDWILQSYEGKIADTSTLFSCFVTNQAYAGLQAPTIKVGGKCRANLRSRYLTEDVPFGLVVTKGIAGMCGLPTPTIDQVLATTSRWMDAEYYIDGKAVGRDIGKTRHPVNFGITKLEQLFPRAT
jgi:hypothetical protein